MRLLGLHLRSGRHRRAMHQQRRAARLAQTQTAGRSRARVAWCSRAHNAHFDAQTIQRVKAGSGFKVRSSEFWFAVTQAIRLLCVLLFLGTRAIVCQSTDECNKKRRGTGDGRPETGRSYGGVTRIS